MFVSGTFVLTDTLHSTFTTLFNGIYQNVSFEVRGKAAFSGPAGTAVRNPISDTIAAKVRAVPGVEDAVGTVQGYAQLIAPDGKAVNTSGAPTIGLSFNPVTQMSPLHIRSGAPPTTSDEVAIDAATATKYHFHVGDRVRVLLTGPPETFTVSGIVTFGTANNLAGATIAAFDLPTAQKIFDRTGQYDAIDVLTQPGANTTQIQKAIARILPPKVEVVTGQTVANEATSSVNQALGFFSTALLVFAFISLFVGGFTIFNTFSIIVGQRTRELALLRILGASRRQVFRSVLAEASIVGLVASLIGLALGVAAAAGLEALLDSFGITLPTGGLVFEPRTVIVGLIVGVGVTVVSAISPARRAVRIPPVAALSEHDVGAAESSRRRIVVGTALAVLGIVGLAAGLTIPAIQLVGLGAVGVFIGIGMLAPLVARPLSSVIGRPLAACSASPASSAGRTRCAAPGARPRPGPPSWSAWPSSPPSPSSGPRSPARPPPASTRPSVPTTSSPVRGGGGTGEFSGLHGGRRPAASPVSPPSRPSTPASSSSATTLQPDRRLPDHCPGPSSSAWQRLGRPRPGRRQAPDRHHHGPQRPPGGRLLVSRSSSPSPGTATMTRGWDLQTQLPARRAFW
jgi:putative ABC transport system permease protein